MQPFGQVTIRGSRQRHKGVVGGPLAATECELGPVVMVCTSLLSHARMMPSTGPVGLLLVPERKIKLISRV